MPAGAIQTPPPAIVPDGFTLNYNGSWSIIPVTYAAKRSLAYPTVGNQLDMLWQQRSTKGCLSTNRALSIPL